MIKSPIGGKCQGVKGQWGTFGQIRPHLDRIPFSQVPPKPPMSESKQERCGAELKQESMQLICDAPNKISLIAWTQFPDAEQCAGCATLSQ